MAIQSFARFHIHFPLPLSCAATYFTSHRRLLRRLWDMNAYNRQKQTERYYMQECTFETDNLKQQMRAGVYQIQKIFNLYIERLSESKYVTHIFTARPSGLES